MTQEPAAERAPEVHFRRVEKGSLTERDAERILELLGSAFGRWPGVDTTASPADHLRWKTSSPGAIFSAYLGEAGDELVLTETCLGYRMLLRGRDAVRMQFVDTAVHPEWRGRGVSSASLKLRQRTVSPLYDLSIIDAQSTIMIQRARPFGTRPLGNRIHPLVLPLRHRRVVEKWLADRGISQRLAHGLGVVLAPLLHAASRPRTRADGAADAAGGNGTFRIAAVERFDTRIDSFFAAAAPQWEVVVQRSHQHLDWRYDRRGGNFHLRVAEDAAGSVLGYAVGNQRGERGHLIDLMALPGRLDVVAGLVAAIDGELADRGCADVLCWLPELHFYRETLHRAGYFDARAKPFITYRPCGASAEELEFLGAPETRVHFTLGDNDLV